MSNEILQKLKEYAKVSGLILNTNKINRFMNATNAPINQYGFAGYEIDEDPYLIDIIVVKSIEEERPVIINGIKYMEFDRFYKDLIVTLKDRYNKVQGKVQFLLPNVIRMMNEELSETGLNFEEYVIDKEYFLLESYEVISEYFYNKMVNTYSEEWETLKADVFDVLLDAIEVYEDDKNDENMINTIRVISDNTWDLFAEFQNKHPQNERFFIDLSEILVETYFIGLISIFEKVNINSFSKFLKTYQRYEITEGITWDSLSTGYKIYLVRECIKLGSDADVKLFDVSETCQSYLSCGKNYVNSMTNSCVTSKNKEKYTKTRRLVQSYVKNSSIQSQDQ